MPSWNRLLSLWNVELCGSRGGKVLQFDVLGSLGIQINGQSVAMPRGPKVRQMLALMILKPGTVVPHSSLVDELWGKRPPKTALSTIRTHIYHLRRALADEVGATAPNLIDTWNAGYVLRAVPEQVDAEAFTRLAKQGETLLRAGDTEEASLVLSRALDLWNGGVLTDVQCGSVLEQHVQHLQEIHMRVQQQRIHAEMQLGKHATIAAELRSLVSGNPLNEWLHGQLITALYLSGRRGEALHAYQRLRSILQEELGLDPSRPVQLIQQEILSGGESRYLLDSSSWPMSSYADPVAAAC